MKLFQRPIVRFAPFLVTIIAVSSCTAVGAQRQIQLRGALNGFPSLDTPERVPILGVNADLTAYDEEALNENLDRIKETGFFWVRQTFSWEVIEPAPGQYDWTAYDAIVDATSERGLHLVAVLAESPAWAASIVGAPPDDLAAR